MEQNEQAQEPSLNIPIVGLIERYGKKIAEAEFEAYAAQVRVAQLEQENIQLRQQIDEFAEKVETKTKAKK